MTFFPCIRRRFGARAAGFALTALVGILPTAQAQTPQSFAPDSLPLTLTMPALPGNDASESPLAKYRLPLPQTPQNAQARMEKVVAEIVLSHLGRVPDGREKAGDVAAACFAPGTDPVYVAYVTELLRRNVWSKQKETPLPLDPGGAVSPFTRSPNFQLDGGRWTTTANGSTGARGNPIRLTYSFVPDGTALPGGSGEAATPSDLNARLAATFGSVAAGKVIIAALFTRWSQVTGITYQEVSDDGAALPGNRGILGTRGDVRISSHNIDGQAGILAYDYYPNTSDMVIDSSDFGPYFSQAFSSYRFLRNTVTHEHGHGIGLAHSDPINQYKLMEAYVSTAFDGPQDDDIRGAGRNYGDPYENNDTAATSTVVSLSVGSPAFLGALSTDGSNDVDYFAFSSPAGAQLNVSADAIGSTYLIGPQNGTTAAINTQTINRLTLDLLASDGTTVIATNTSALGSNALLNNVTLTNGGAYFLRISNPTGSTDDIQRYTLSATLAATPSVTSLSPAYATAGSGGFTLTVNGTGFVSGATVTWNGSARTTTFVSSTQLTASIPASDVASAGTGTVRVVNPDGTTSNASVFTVSLPRLSYQVNSVTRPGNINIVYQITNRGPASVTVTISQARLGPTLYNGISTASATIASGASASITLAFPATAGATGATVPLTIDMRAGSAQLQDSRRVTLP